MRLLFISRAYPPITGGIENQNRDLALFLPRFAETQTLANTHGKKALPWFLPYALLAALFRMRHCDTLLLGDGVLGIVGWAVKLAYPKKKVASVIHGLDLTFKSAFYQRFWVHFFLPRLDLLIAVSAATRATALAKGLDPEKVIVIPNGIDPESFTGSFSRADLENLLGIDLEGKIVLLTAGRLARRKGVAWFIEQVLPGLPENILYIVAGDGPDRESVAAAKKASPAKERILLLGKVSDSDRNLLLGTADIFVQQISKYPAIWKDSGLQILKRLPLAGPW
ncbi:MAG: glycosyltransferase family 4 protein [Candidatus Moraniibacteriota bacterium]